MTKEEKHLGLQVLFLQNQNLQLQGSTASKQSHVRRKKLTKSFYLFDKNKAIFFAIMEMEWKMLRR